MAFAVTTSSSSTAISGSSFSRSKSKGTFVLMFGSNGKTCFLFFGCLIVFFVFVFFKVHKTVRLR